MKLTGKLREQVKSAHSRDEVREAIAKAGMLLSDDELEQVSGGDGDEVPMVVNQNTCFLCGNDEPGKVTFVGTDSTGRLFYFYCGKCKGTFIVYGDS